MKSDIHIRVLFMDDEPELIHHYIKQTKEDGFDVLSVKTEADAKEVLRDGSIDVAILDANLLPGVNIEKIKQAQESVGDEPFVTEEGAGYRIATWIRDNLGATGVIVLTSERTDAADRINGLDCGADDYVIKGVPPAELISRIKALLRRLKPQTSKITFGQFALDEANRALQTTGGLSLPLTSAEASLLKELAMPPLAPKTRNELYLSVFKKELPTENDRSIDNLVSKIRRKVRNDLGAEIPLSTLYGGGYVIRL